MGLEELASRVTAAFPQWCASKAVFLTRLESAHRRLGSLDAIHAEDLLLATAALAGADSAVEELDRRVGRVAATVVARFRADTAFLDEVQQRARVKLLMGSDRAAAALSRYGGEASLDHWLKAVVTSTVVDARRVRRTERDRTGETQLADVAARQTSADEALAHGHHRAAITEALREALKQLDAEDRVLMRLRFVDGHTLDDAARALGVHRTTAQRRLERAQETLNAALRDGLKARLRLSTRSLDSMLRAFRPSLAERLSQLMPRPSLRQK